MKTNCYYSLKYAPNKVVYVYEVNKENIKYICFLRPKNEQFGVIAHWINVCNKKDFKLLKDYEPIQQIKDLVIEFKNSL